MSPSNYAKYYILNLLINITMEYFVLLRLFKNYDNEIKGNASKHIISFGSLSKLSESKQGVSKNYYSFVFR